MRAVHITADVCEVETVRIAGNKSLIQARKEAGMSQDDLGKRIGTDQSTVSKIERGVRRLDVVEMLEVAEVLGFDPHEVIDNLLKIKQ